MHVVVLRTKCHTVTYYSGRCKNENNLYMYTNFATSDYPGYTPIDCARELDTVAYMLEGWIPLHGLCLGQIGCTMQMCCVNCKLVKLMRSSFVLARYHVLIFEEENVCSSPRISGVASSV